jgi:putative ABC transport system permease protein
MGFKIVEGRSFSEKYGTDSTRAYLLNEAAVARLGWQGNAVGREFTWLNPLKGAQRGRVVGVVQDFHYEPLRQLIEPAFFAIAPDWIQMLTVRLRPGNLRETMASLEDIWSEVVPAYPFDYQFLDEQLDQIYRAEERFGSLFGTFAALAIFIACLGLFGLAAYAAEQRRREIGVRKVLGATVGQITALLSKDFVKLVFVGFVIAVPVGWYAMQQWLADFAYRIEMGVTTFLIAGGVAIAIALATVSWQAVRAALANPVESLRSE